jgi:hypothetical protein
MDVACSVKYRNPQLGGMGSDPVGFVRSVKRVRAFRLLRYKIDFKHLLGMRCDFVYRPRFWNFCLFQVD